MILLFGHGSIASSKIPEHTADYILVEAEKNLNKEVSVNVLYVSPSRYRQIVEGVTWFSASTGSTVWKNGYYNYTYNGYIEVAVDSATAKEFFKKFGDSYNEKKAAKPLKGIYKILNWNSDTDITSDKLVQNGEYFIDYTTKGQFKK
jgi:translation initiation factor 2 alpha subunit (eIF-2alpha)